MSDKENNEEVIPKAVVVRLPKDDNATAGPVTGPVEVAKAEEPVEPANKKGKMKAIFKNKYAIVNLVMLAGQIYEPIRTWSLENPEAVLSMAGIVNLMLAKFTGRKLYGDAPKKEKKSDAKK